MPNAVGIFAGVIVPDSVLNDFGKKSFELLQLAPIQLN